MHHFKIIKIFKTLTLITVLEFCLIINSQAQSYTFKNKAFDLRPEIKSLGLSIRNQSGRPTCTLFSTTFLIEYYTAKKTGEKNLDLSEEYLNAITNRAIQLKTDGSCYSDAIIGYGQYGIVPEKDAPYSNIFDPEYLQGTDPATMALLEKGKKTRFLIGDVEISPTASIFKPGLTDAQFNKLLAHLDAGNPAGIGYGGNDTNGQYFTLDNGQKAFSGANLDVVGAYAHSVPLVGYKVDAKVPGGGYVIFRNSYGTTWGDEGYGYMTFEYLKKYTYDFLTLTLFSRVTALNVPELENRYLTLKDILIKHSEISRKLKLPYLQKDGVLRINQKLR